MSLIKLKNVSKFYNNQNNISSGFSKINLTLDSGEFVSITGESGSGKSTLLNVISGLDSYEEGEMYINGEETSHYTEEDYELYRRKYIGNIFQNFNLINSYTVYQNIELVYFLNGADRKAVRKDILELIDTVGLTKYKNTKVSKLSGGQKQRVAIARVLAKDTPIIVADEPTGSLDQRNAKSVIELLHKISTNKLVIIVTHNYDQVEEYTTRKITMSDGKIIEDKKIVKVDKVEVIESESNDITFKNKLTLGFRNSFNILTKFLLLFAVYLFLVVSTFSQYSNLRKIKYEQDEYGFNTHFSDTSTNRIIVNKKDRTSFTNDEITRIANLDNIEKLVEDDILIDMHINMGIDDIYFDGSIINSADVTEMDMGSLPAKDNEVALVVSKYDYYAMTYGESLIGKKLKFNDELSNMIEDEFAITGIKYDNNEDLFEANGSTKFIFTDKFTKRIGDLGTIKYSEIFLGIANKKVSQREMYFNIMKNSSLKKGEVYAFSNLIGLCTDFDCTDEEIKLYIKDIYRESVVELKIKDVITKDNASKLIHDKKYEDIEYTLFMNEDDYNTLFKNDNYQISVYLKDTLKSSQTIEELQKLGLNTLFMREMLSNELATVMGVLQIFRGIVFIVASIALFFISYFIIKLIFKSRNIYYSTIRILGAKKSQAASILRIELLFDLNIAFLTFIALIMMVHLGVINSSYLSEIVKYFSIIDYLIVYLILNLMSILISNRYANKLFKTSVMNAYREEV